MYIVKKGVTGSFLANVDAGFGYWMNWSFWLMCTLDDMQMCQIFRVIREVKLTIT